MIKPPPLKIGDSVALIAPARQVLEEDMAFAIQTFENWGLKVDLGKYLYNKEAGYFSAPDELRLVDLQEALNNPEIKAIICALGGYGTTRIIDQLDFTLAKQNPKWIVGFSDITALHATAFKNGMLSIHGNMPIVMAKERANEANQSLYDLLFNNDFKTTTWQSHSGNKLGEAEGKLMGGNLTLLVDALATKTENETKDCILIVEEIDEHLYKIDRMFNHLKRAGKLENLKGLLVGYFTNNKQGERAFHLSFEEIILHHTRDYNFPISFGFPSGHEQPNMPWIHGAKATLICSANQSTLNYI